MTIQISKFSFVFLIASAIFLFSPKIVFAQVVINELMPNPSTGPDWVELYNSINQDIDLNGWILDDEDTVTNMVDIKEATISAKGFFVFDVGSRLNKSSDTIYLKDKQGLTIDEYTYTKDPGADVSLGRMPDGGDWGICAQPTKGSGNQCVLPTPTPIEEPEETPTPTPTSTLTPTPTKKPTPTLKPSPTSTPAGEILGEGESATNAFYPLATEEAESTSQSTSSFKTRWLPKIFLGVGFLLLFGASFWVWYTKLRWPEQESS